MGFFDFFKNKGDQATGIVEKRAKSRQWTISSPSIVALFSQGNNLANEQKFAEALRIYIDIFSFDRKKELGWIGETVKTAPKPEGKLVLDSELMGLVEIYKADCLRNLGRLEDAKAKMEDPKVWDLALRFSNLAHLFQYFSFYGMILGEMGDIEGMDEQLSKSLGMAVEEFEDPEKCIECWRLMFLFGEQHKDWAYLLETCPQGVSFARASKLFPVEYLARMSLAKAHRGVNDFDAARREATWVLSINEKSESPSGVKEWRDFLESLPGIGPIAQELESKRTGMNVGDFEKTMTDSATGYLLWNKDENDHENLFSKGHALMESGDFKNALAIFQTIVEKDETHSDAWLRVGICQSRLGHPEDGVRAIKGVLANNPKHLQANYTLGGLYHYTGRYTDAVSCYEAAIKSNPQYVWPYFRMGEAFMSMADYPKAIEIISKGLKVYEEKPKLEYRAEIPRQALLNLGRCHFMMNAYDNALKNYESVTNTEPEIAEAWLGKARVCYANKDYKKASGFCEMAIRIDPGLIDAYCYQSGAFQGLGDEKRSQTKLKKWKEMREKHPERTSIRSVEEKDGEPLVITESDVVKI